MKTIAKYKWTKEGKLGNYYNVELVADNRTTHVYGEVSVPSTVAKAVEFMYVVCAKKLVVDEYTVVLVQ